AAEAIALYALRARIALRPPPPARAHAYLALVGALALANSLTLLYVLDDPKQTTNLFFLVIGAGFLFLDRRWFAGFLAIAVGGFVVELARGPPSPDWTHYVFGMVSAVALAGIVHYVRARNIVGLDEARRLAGDAAIER